MDLFNVERDFVDRLGTKPRKATENECRAYLLARRHRLGLIDFEHVSLEWGGGYSRGSGDTSVCIGATFGQVIERGGWVGNVHTPAQYENGAYSLLMPGYSRKAQVVTMETLNDAGEVVASQALPVEPKKGGVVWSKEAVRAAAGPVAKVKAAKAPKVASKPAGRAKRTAAHVRAVKMAWAQRRARIRAQEVSADRLREIILQQSIAADHMRMREQVQGELRRVTSELAEAREWAALLEAENLQLTQTKPKLRLVA